MRPLGIAAFGCLLLAACSVTPPVSQFRPVARGDAAAFTPLVMESSSPSPPSCMEPSNAPLDTGSRAFAALYPQSPARQVTVTVNGAGDPIKYLDVRGDLSESDDEMGDRTTIGLFLEGGYAVLSNREGAGPPDFLEVPVDEALTLQSLGNPSEVMREVLATCAGAP